MAQDIRVELILDAIRRLLHRGSVTEPALLRHAEATAAEARRRAPTGRANANPPPGTLRDHITTRVGEDADGMFVDVVSTARSDKGYPYAARVNKRKPYLDKDTIR